MFGCFLFYTNSVRNFVRLHPGKSVWLVWPVLLVCKRRSKSMLLPLLLGRPLDIAYWGGVGWLPRHLQLHEETELNHVVTSYGDCTSNKLNCNCYRVCVVGVSGWCCIGWSFGKCVLFSFVGFSLNEKSALFMSLPIELSCCLRRVCESRNSPCLAIQGLPVICCLEANFCVPFRRVHQNSRGDKWGSRGCVFTVDLTLNLPVF